MNEWVGFVFGITGWLTVIIGGIMSWTKITNKQTVLEGELKACQTQLGETKEERKNCEDRESKRIDNLEHRIYQLENRRNDP